VIEIRLTQGKVAIIDDEDARLAQFRWRVTPKGYAVRHSPRVHYKRASIYLHREVLGVTGTPATVDHINMDRLDCRRCNLRVATASQNGANRGPQRNNTSGFKGVRWFKPRKKWRAQIKTHGKQETLGYFTAAEDAARAYDRAALDAFGEFARLNFAAEVKP
jgi:hypothetical protein